ncbi:hypothetical protein CXX78_00950 [Candidatus Parvarchaeota archaeon]|nr:MAG: hypothetical protein CXX78_00950 [Candidatus Parvarchaeota archaeon]
MNRTMNIEIIKSDKNELELKLDNLTIAEILRVYLNNQGIKFAAWRKEHPDKPIIFRVESSGKTVKKAINEAINLMKKDCDSLLKVLK